MDLLEIRKKFIELSGRYDLVADTTTFADNGADFFINAGQMFLDRMLDTDGAVGRAIKVLKTGKFVLDLFYCRAVLEVVISETDGSSPVKATKNIDLLTKDYTTLTPTRPCQYYPVTKRVSPEVYPANVTSILRGASAVEECELRGVLFDVPADKDYSIDVYGLFYSNPLLEDQATSYWSLRHADILLTASLYKLETFYRNKQGAADWYQSLLLDVQGIDMDAVAEEIAQISQIGD